MLRGKIEGLQQALIAMKMGELRRTSYQVLYLFRAHELTADNINEPLIGYLEGQLARMQLDS